jgi:uncharacterized protein YoxC
MTSDLWLWLAALTVLLVLVAVLLGLVLAAAKRIDRQAHEIFLAGKDIAGNTVSIWLLEKTNGLLVDMTRKAESVEASGAAIVERLDRLAGGSA